MRHQRMYVPLLILACGAAVIPLTGRVIAGRKHGGYRGAEMSGDPAPPLTSADWAAIVRAHEAGIRGDAGALKDLLPLLHHENRDVRLAALWSLGRIGHPDSLSAIRALADDRDDRLRVTVCARAVAARVGAVQGSMPATREGLAQKMAAVLTGTGLSARTIENTMARRRTEDPRAAALADETLVQLADMALVAADRGIQQPASASPVDLSLHPMAKLQAELSAYPKAERIRRLAASLAGAQSGAGDTQRHVQLLIDEGPQAVPAVLAQLKAQTVTSAPNTHVPFAQLFRVLGGLGGPEALQAVAAFRTHPLLWVRHYAQIEYEALSAGVKRYRITDYANAYTDHYQG
ncbi:MAG: HEAT repeat domain-containing protein [Armatimonadetes bacterium]|nr:HEAT repeat domain-containing protein [Armatimonadota bacterium]